MSYPPNFIKLIISKKESVSCPRLRLLKNREHTFLDDSDDSQYPNGIPSCASDRGADGAEAAERTREGPSASMCFGSCIKKLSSVPWQLKMLEEEEEIYLQSMNKNWRSSFGCYRGCN